MSTIYEEIVSIIGNPLPGYEPIFYTACIIVVLYFMYALMSIFNSIIQYLGGKRL